MVDVKGIGWPDYKKPDAFEHHDVAWSGPLGQSRLIWDACFSVVQDNQETLPISRALADYRVLMTGDDDPKKLASDRPWGKRRPVMPEPIDICAAAEEGYWELLPCDSKVLAVHAVLMHSGRVLFFAGSGNNVPHFNAHDTRSVVWDYQNGTFHTPVTPFDVFCSGHTVLPDGKVLVAGGTQAYEPNFLGLRSSWLFDPLLEEWIRVGDMA